MKFGILPICACAVIGALIAPHAAEARVLRIDSTLPCGNNGGSDPSGNSWTVDPSNPFPTVATFNPGPLTAGDTVTACKPNTTLANTLAIEANVSGIAPTAGSLYSWNTATSMDAQVAIWTLGANAFGAATELELNGWCNGGSGTASLTWGGATYTTSCATNSAVSNDFLFSSAGGFVGFADDTVNSSTFGTVTASGAPQAGWTVTGGGGTVSVPEPDSLFMLLGAIAALLLVRRRPRAPACASRAA